jgi:hypothetical protein
VNNSYVVDARGAGQHVWDRVRALQHSRFFLANVSTLLVQ